MRVGRGMDLGCSDASVWKEALSLYPSRIQTLSVKKNKPDLVSLDDFYCNQLPLLLHQRNPNPFITTPELSTLMQWKLTRGKWRSLPYFLFFFLPPLNQPRNFICCLFVYFEFQAASVGFRVVPRRRRCEIRFSEGVSEPSRCIQSRFRAHCVERRWSRHRLCRFGYLRPSLNPFHV